MVSLQLSFDSFSLFIITVWNFLRSKIMMLSMNYLIAISLSYSSEFNDSLGIFLAE